MIVVIFRLQKSIPALVIILLFVLHLIHCTAKHVIRELLTAQPSIRMLCIVVDPPWMGVFALLKVHPMKLAQCLAQIYFTLMH